MTDSEQGSYNDIGVWLEKSKDQFHPPVCNKLMHGPDGQLFVMYVGGPNQRKDFHMEEGEELFYMVKGDMTLRVLERGTMRDIVIKEGEIFLLPSRIPHSPQRFPDTVGLVIERQRLPVEKDCLRYFMDNSVLPLWERWIQCTNLGTQIAELIKEYFASPEHRTGKPTSSEHFTPPPYIPDSERRLGDPFVLNQWLEENAERIEKQRVVSIFDHDYQSKVVVVGGTDATDFAANQNAERWIWQIRGSANLQYDLSANGDEYFLQMNSSFLIKKGQSFVLKPRQEEDERSYSLVVEMDPKQGRWGHQIL
ncbi:3-hydroxyanthranilate 3,4-dioxygenase-like [Paramacrobiotus metropolitanus]|uniref:3-hydroxyanthranilate 3,4-dioxygenase-like n=1 Tax=Paramacrobiotus metropolitanus TaxID=2943436 RepID=UPI0024459B5C|nr:3-hydroxyanthranilate 3,4-dioxygenase-like [Paramacrobiotus metropolitanus]